MARGRILVARGSPILVEEEKGGVAFVALAPAASLVGLERLLELVPGDRIEYRWAKEIASVRIADVLEVGPVVNTEAPFLLAEGELVAAFRQGTAMTIFDVRPVEAFRNGHIRGAISVPADAPREKSFGRLREKAGPFVVYGEGPRDGAAQPLARALLGDGFRDVRVLQGGVRQWLVADNFLEVEAGAISCADIERDRWVVVDVRPLEEGRESRPAGAISVPPDAFRWQDFDGAVPLRSILLVGADLGDQSPMEMADRIRLLRSQRATRTALAIRVLRGGFAAWKQAGLPLDEGMPETTEFTLRPPRAGEIGLPEFEALWARKGDDKAVFLDLRRVGTSGEPWVVEIPLEQLPERIGELPKGREVITFCTLGERSHVAAELLRANGFRARFLRAASPH